MGILNFGPKICIRCKNILTQIKLFCFFCFVWTGGGQSVCLHHKGSMIGVQCQLMICGGHIRASKGAFQIFVVNGSMGKLTLKSNFALLSSRSKHEC